MTFEFVIGNVCGFWIFRCPCTPKYLIDRVPLEVLVDVQNPDPIATSASVAFFKLNTAGYIDYDGLSCTPTCGKYVPRPLPRRHSSPKQNLMFWPREQIGRPCRLILIRLSLAGAWKTLSIVAPWCRNNKPEMRRHQ
jgi:hypothetical protein